MLYLTRPRTTQTPAAQCPLVLFGQAPLAQSCYDMSYASPSHDEFGETDVQAIADCDLCIRRFGPNPFDVSKKACGIWLTHFQIISTFGQAVFALHHNASMPFHGICGVQVNDLLVSVADQQHSINSMQTQQFPLKFGKRNSPFEYCGSMCDDNNGDHNHQHINHYIRTVEHPQRITSRSTPNAKTQQ